MRYTKSKDGVLRCTVLLRLRFTLEEMEAIRKAAKNCPVNKGDWHSWLESYAALGIEGQLCCEDQS